MEKDWGQEEKGMTEDEMVGWHNGLNGHEIEWTPGVGDGQGDLVCCHIWGHKESDTTERLKWTDWICKILHISEFWSLKVYTIPSVLIIFNLAKVQEFSQVWIPLLLLYIQNIFLNEVYTNLKVVLSQSPLLALLKLLSLLIFDNSKK